ncbi:MAG: glycosyltransferase family 2 protein [Candidatus Bathyarchaeota archaeon]|nr:MAG: glycosyltransferase family 2 protein [Candidatus Bathyarchaeota archaeon]
MDRVSLLLPVHNEAGNIEQVITDFYNELNGKIPIEIVVAEDGSTDGTKEILKDLCNKIPIVLLTDNQRKGYMGGLRDGLLKVTGDYVLFCDSDGQHFPSDFWKLYHAKDNFDIVSGWRIDRADSFFRRSMSRVFQWFARRFFTLPPIHDITAPYRLVRTDIAKQISHNVKYMVESYWTEFTIRACAMGARIKEIPVRHRLRLSGSTRVYTLSKIPRIAYDQLDSLRKIRQELS